MDCLTLGVLEQPRQHSKNVSTKKEKQLAGCDGGHLWSQATLEAEVGGTLEPGRSRLQRAVMVPG